MTVTLTSEQIAEALHKYHQKKAEQNKINLEIEKEKTDAQAKRLAFYAAKRAAQKPRKTRVPHICPCGAAIPAFTVAYFSLELTPLKKGVYGNGNCKRVYYCNTCHPIELEVI